MSKSIKTQLLLGYQGLQGLQYHFLNGICYSVTQSNGEEFLSLTAFEKKLFFILAFVVVV